MKEIKKVVASEQPIVKNSLNEIVEKVKKEETSKEDKKKAKKKGSDKGEGDEESGDEIKNRSVSSFILPDGSLVEMIYDRKTGKTSLVVFKDGKVELKEQVEYGTNNILVPMSPKQNLLTSGYVLFPSEVTEYVSSEVLYEEVRSFVNKYVYLNEEFLSVVSVYILMTWVFDRFSAIPYLRVKGIWGSGKSRLLSVAGSVCYKAVMAGGSISNAALFRTLDLLKPTLVFDEAELGAKESTEMRMVLRQGFTDNTPVSRMDPRPDGNMYIKTFGVFGPKIIASSEDFKDTALESRCLTGWMPPILKSGRPVELSDDFKREALALRNKLIMFRFKTRHLVVADDALLEDLKLPRLRQTGLAIMSVAKMLSSHAVEDVKRFLLEYEIELGSEQADTLENDVLVCILELLTMSHLVKDGVFRIGEHITEKFNRMYFDDYTTRETREYNSRDEGVMKYNGQRVSSKKIGHCIRKMGFRTDRDREGIYLSISKEYSKIRVLAKRYGLDSMYTLPENNPSGVKKIEEVVTKEEKQEKALDEAKHDGDEDWEREESPVPIKVSP